MRADPRLPANMRWARIVREKRTPGPPGRPHPTSCAGGLIRTLSVSLLAVSAVAIGVLISKQLQERPAPDGGALAGEVPRPDPSLDAIRSAGF